MDNNNGKLLYMTPNFPNLFAFNGRELLNTTIDDLLPDTIRTFHKDLIDNAIKFSNLNYSFKNQRDFILKGKNGGLYNVKVFIKCIPNLSFGLIYIGYITKSQEQTFVIVLDKDLNINGFTDITKTGAPFTMNNNYGLTQSLCGHHIGTVIPEILLQMEYKNDKFLFPKNDIELKGNLYPVSTWKELDHKVEAVLNRIKEKGSLQDKDDEKKETIKEYEKLVNEITLKYPHAFSVFYRISTRNFINGKYTYHRLIITNDLVNLNENSIKDNKSLDKSTFKNDNEINENIGDNANINGEKTSKGIKFKLYSETNRVAQKTNDKQNIEGEKGEGEKKENEGNIGDADDFIPNENLAVAKKNKEVKKIMKAGSKSEDSSILTKISVEMAGFNRLKGFILSKRETYNVRLMKVLVVLYGIISIAFLVYDSIQNKANLNDMGEYLKENLYFNHSKIAVAILYFSGLNLKWLRDGYIDDDSCPAKTCRIFYTDLMEEAIDDIKTQKENFTKFYEDFRDILKIQIKIYLDLYNLNYQDSIDIDTDNLLNLLVFYGLKLKSGLNDYFNKDQNSGVFQIASSNLLRQSLTYFESTYSVSFKSEQKEEKIQKNFTLFPFSLVFVVVMFALIIIGLIYLVYKIYTNEIYFLEKLINFNSQNFEVYLKSLEDIKKRLRLENEEDEEKDEDMEMDSKKETKKEEDEENAKKRKKIGELDENKRKKKDKKSNKFIHVKQKKKRIMGMYFFKSNLFFTIKIIVILVLSISYYLVSTLVNSHNKKNFLDFDQTIDAIEAVYKETFELYKKLKIEMEQYENVIVAKKEAIQDFCADINNVNNNATKYFEVSETGETCNNTDCATTCANNDTIAKALDCAEGFNCSNTIINSFCEGIKCILRKPNYQMYILSNEELTTPKLGSLLMPLVSDVDSSSTETEQKLNTLYNNDSCKILIKEDDIESYDYCKIFWSGILVKGMEQGITQLGLSVASVTDELKWIDSSLINNTNRFSDMTYKNDSAFFQFSVFVEFYLFESYLQTYRIFDVLRDVKLDNIKNNFNVILYCYLIGSIVLVAIAFYFVNDSKYLLNSFLNFVGIFPVKYLMEDNNLYHETLNLETDIF